MSTPMERTVATRAHSVNESNGKVRATLASATANGLGFAANGDMRL